MTLGISVLEELSLAKSTDRPYTPDPEQIALMPAISGDAINGLGESEFRRATPVYWRDPETLHHGALQKWFYTRQADDEAIEKARALRAEILNIEIPPVADESLQTRWK